MRKLKKLFSLFVGTAMTANIFATMPFTAFADEEIERTYTYDDYEVTYDVTNSWGNTELVAVTLSNTSDTTIENWMLYFEPNGQVHNVVNASESYTSTGTAYFRNSWYNANVEPNSSTTFNYMVDDCSGIPDEFVLCQTRAEKETGYDVSIKVNETWGNSFNGEIILQNNTESAIEAWELMVDTNFTITEITNSWAATVTELEPYSYMLKGTYTGFVPANSSVSLGFTGVMDGEPEISNYSLTEVVVDETLINLINIDVDWSELPDLDEDGLPDEYEEEYRCDPMNPDSDSDGLPDGYEILTIGSDPANAHSMDAMLSDGQYDNDQDNLSNYDEYALGTDPIRIDSDFDGLSDNDEINIYGTEPLNFDTDEDGLSDGDEIALGLNPLVSDSDGDGTFDNEEKILQNMEYNTDSSDTAIDFINISFEGTGYINNSTKIKSVMKTDWMCSNIVGLVGEPYDISSESKFSEATITFKITSDFNNNIADLKILWYDEKEQRFVEMETIPNIQNSTLTTTVKHFSKYLIVDSSEWYNSWMENNYPNNGKILHSAITIDCSGSMAQTDPECYRVVAANGYVDVMSVADLASVILFSDTASEEQGLTNEKAKLEDAIEKVDDYGHGTTNYQDALRYSIDSLETQDDSNAENVIIFLSDGRPTNNVDGVGIEVPEDEFDYSLVDEAASKGIRIYTIGLTDYVNENILKEMARRTNGEYYYANTAIELVEYFLTINMGKKYNITTDTDEDGIPDLFEECGMPIANGNVINTDLNNPDTDGDGLKDGDEIIMHIVNDEAEVEKAYNYMYDYIPEAYISSNGGIYFTIESAPDKSDTDGDFDLDANDPDAMNYQLNGFFAHQMGKLQLVAKEYLGDSYEYDIEDRYSGKKDIWLCSYYIRQFNKNYTSNMWHTIGGSDTKFVSYVNTNYPELYAYFVNKNELYVNSSADTLDLYHCYATISAILDTANPLINILAGWGGDLSTVTNQAYELTYIKKKYDNIGDALYVLMGDDSYNFGMKDLYADIDASNIGHMVTSNYDNIEIIINDYFTLSDTNKINDFIKNGSVSKSFIQYMLYSVAYPLLLNYELSVDDKELCAEAFTKFLNDTFGVKIE